MQRTMQRTRWLGLSVIAIALMIVTSSIVLAATATAKKYQVTGTVVSSDDKMIEVKKGDENWQIDRTADTKVDGKVAVGTKVTVHYHMVADQIEAKGK